MSVEDLLETYLIDVDTFQGPKQEVTEWKSAPEPSRSRQIARVITKTGFKIEKETK